MEKQVEQKLSDANLHDASSLESTLGGTPVEFTPEEEKTLLRRIDWHILPGLSVLYLLCFLDRTYAYHPLSLLIVGISAMLGLLTCDDVTDRRLQGLEADLGMEGNDYNLALCLFFVTYVVRSFIANMPDTFFLKSPPILLSAKFAHLSSSLQSCSAGGLY